MDKRFCTVFRAFAPCLIALAVAGCGSVPAPSTGAPPPQGAVARVFDFELPSLQKPALLTNNTNSGALQYWPVSDQGGKRLITIDGKFGVATGFAMAADGNSVVAADYGSSQIVIENVVTEQKTELNDPNGQPADVAVGSDHSIYVLNYAKPDGNVTVYPQGTGPPVELSCNLIYIGEYIAVDSDGNIYVNGYESGNAIGVVEIPHGASPGQCSKVDLRPEYGYVAGIAYDPKSGDLIVMDNPGECAGGEEGHIVIYSKPYQGPTGRSVDLGGNCAGGLRLNASSTRLFYGDTTVDEGYFFIRQRSFPGGKHVGSVYTGGSPGGFTTIPNRLPN